MDLRVGDQRTVLADVEEVDAMITDPPYSARVHRAGALIEGKDDAERSVDIGYDAFTETDIEEFCNSWSPRVKGWMAIHTSHDLIAFWEEYLAAQGRYVFPPVPCVMRGMSVRLQGDGPCSWTCYLIVARPREKRFMGWGALPGAYVGPPPHAKKGESIVMGQKPQWLINAILRDYSRRGDLVVDPFLGGGTTAIACKALDRRFVGAEWNVSTYAKAAKRIAEGGAQTDIFAAGDPVEEWGGQVELFSE